MQIHVSKPVPPYWLALPVLPVLSYLCDDSSSTLFVCDCCLSSVLLVYHTCQKDIPYPTAHAQKKKKKHLIAFADLFKLIHGSASAIVTLKAVLGDLRTSGRSIRGSLPFNVKRQKLAAEKSGVKQVCKESSCHQSLFFFPTKAGD